MSTTKLDADGLAAKRFPYERPTSDTAAALQAGLQSAYAAAIREHSQPLVDELATVKAERDKLLAQLQMLVRMSSDGRSSEARLKAERDEMREAMEHFCNRVDNGEVRSKKTYALFRAILEKYPKP